VSKQLRTTRIAEGVIQIHLSTRLLRRVGMAATPYLVDDVLVDTGFRHVRSLVLKEMAGRELRAICCTHHHEDHPGNAGPLARRHGCPVHLRNPQLQWTEGVRRMPLYRRIYWGRPGPYPATEYPDVVQTARRSLRPIPTPGHSGTHTALFDEQTGYVFVGDLYMSGGVTAVMTHENPLDSIDSLRRIADLEPSRLLNGHGLTLDGPAERLRAKADRIEETAHRILYLYRQGHTQRAIERAVFRGGWRQDRNFALVSAGEFRRRNFVTAVLRHAGYLG